MVFIVGGRSICGGQPTMVGRRDSKLGRRQEPRRLRRKGCWAAAGGDAGAPGQPPAPRAGAAADEQREREREQETGQSKQAFGIGPSSAGRIGRPFPPSVVVFMTHHRTSHDERPASRSGAKLDSLRKPLEQNRCGLTIRSYSQSLGANPSPTATRGQAPRLLPCLSPFAQYKVFLSEPRFGSPEPRFVTLLPIPATGADKRSIRTTKHEASRQNRCLRVPSHRRVRRSAHQLPTLNPQHPTLRLASLQRLFNWLYFGTLS